MEQIELPIISPRAELAGITSAISGLERIDALMRQIEGRSKLTLKVDVSGADGIRNMAVAYDDLLGTLNQMGHGDWADKLKRGLATPGEAMGQIKKEALIAGNALDVLQRKIEENQATFKSRKNDTAYRRNEGDKDFFGQQDAIDKRLREQFRMREQLQLKVAQFQKADTLSDALPMTYKESRKSVNTAAAEAGKLAGEETKLAEASGMSKDALAAQAMVVAEKTKLMSALAGSVAKVTSAEKKLADQSDKTKEKQKATTAVHSDTALLSTRTVKSGGGGDLTTSKYRGEKGSSRTYRPDGTIVEDRSVMADYKEQQRVIDANYKKDSAVFASQGFGKGSAQRNARLKQKQEDLDDLAEKMNKAGMDNSSPRSAAGAIGMQLGDSTLSERNKGEAYVRKQDDQARATAEKQRAAAERQAAQAAARQSKERERQANADWKAAQADAAEQARQAKQSAMQAAAQLHRQTYDAGGASDVEGRKFNADGSVTLSRQRGAVKHTETRDAAGNITGSRYTDANEIKKKKAAAKAAADQARKDAEEAQREAEAQQRAADNRAQFGGLPGDARVRQRKTMSGSTTTTSTKGGKKHTETTDASGAVTASSIADVGGLEKAHKSLGAQFVANTAKVALWTGSVGLLYGALGAIKSGFTEAFSLDRKFATLQAVFKGTEAEARGLMNTTLAMGAAHGRAAGEAVEAVTEWSRAQLSAAEAGEALRVSLVAANVAEISSAEAGKNLAAIYQTNSLKITELSGVLGMMNSVSNTTKTTTKDLLDGFAQVGPLAAEAGISIAQTNAILGTTVAATARSGSQIGNTFKAMIVSLSDPRIQDYLRGRFNIESRTQDGGIKSGQEQMDDLFVASRGMNRAERGEMLVNVAGKHQASKVEAILENYPEAARKAIESQLSLNSAQIEQNKILDTTASKWETLKTQWATAFDTLHQNFTKKPINSAIETAGGIAKGAGSYIEVLSSPEEKSDDRSLGRKILDFHTAPFRSLGKIFTPSYWKGVGDRRDKLRRDDALNYDSKAVQGDIENINQSAAQASAMKDTQVSIIRTMRTRKGSLPEQYAKDVKQLAMTIEKNPEKQAALIKSLVDSQGNEAGTEALLGPYYRRASTLESNSLLGEAEHKRFALQKADMMEAEMRNNADFIGDDPRAQSNRQQQKQQIEMLRTAGAAQGRTSFKDDEAGRMANLLVNPAQETAAALEASKSKRGLFGDGFSYRIKAMSEISEAGARVNSLQGRAGVDPAEYAKSKEDLMGARARLRVSDRDDMNMRAARNIETGIARIGGGTDALAGSRRADFFESKRAEAVGGGVFGNRQKEVELIAAATGALREQHDIGMAIAKTEADIVSARERQNIEAGKALQMASREDQARSALLKGFTERNGKLSPEQFQFLSSDFRQSAVRLNPDSVPSALTGAGEAEQSLAMMRETATKLDAVVAGLTVLGSVARDQENQRDAQLRVEMNINANDNVAELMRSFSELATAKLEQVFTQYGAEVDASIKRMEGAGKGGGAGVPVLFGE